MMSLATRCFVIVVVALAGCGGAAKPAAEPGEEGPVVGPPQVAWSAMTHEQRARYMGAVVMPKMKPLFTQFDGKTFADFNCATCHGDGAKDKTFKMPNGGLFVLPSSPAGFSQLMTDKPDYMKFMSTQVKPQMAQLLGMPEFDPANPKPDAFGCHGCHEMKPEGT